MTFRAALLGSVSLNVMIIREKVRMWEGNQVNIVPRRYVNLSVAP